MATACVCLCEVVRRGSGRPRDQGRSVFGEARQCGWAIGWPCAAAGLQRTCVKPPLPPIMRWCPWWGNSASVATEWLSGRAPGPLGGRPLGGCIAVLPGMLMLGPRARGDRLSEECFAVKRTGAPVLTMWLVGLTGCALLAYTCGGGGAGGLPEQPGIPRAGCRAARQRRATTCQLADLC
jgi:hypothetical protein